MDNKGWIKLHRKVLDNPVVCRDAEHLAVWMYLLLEATHDNIDKMFAGRRTTLKPGELITGRKVISVKLNISESKVQRILKRFEIEQQIEQQTSTTSRRISIQNWSEYQEGEQQLNNNRTATEQRLNTLQECKNVKNDNINKEATKKNKSVSEKIEDYLGMISENWREPVEIWLNYKKERKEIYKTERSFKSFFKTIEKESQNNPAIFLAAVEQSIKNNWSGVFPKKHAVEKHPMVDHSKQKVYDEF